MHTKIDIAPETRSKVAALLNARLVELIDLRMQVKQAHWNVRGPTFIAIHEMLDGFAEALDEEIDDVAERAGTLGHLATGTVQQVASGSSLKPYPVDLSAVDRTLLVLQDVYAQLAKLVRQSIEESVQLGDADTADLFTGTSRLLDKQLWKIESHLQV